MMRLIFRPLPAAKKFRRSWFPKNGDGGQPLYCDCGQANCGRKTFIRGHFQPDRKGRGFQFGPRGHFGNCLFLKIPNQAFPACDEIPNIMQGFNLRGNFIPYLGCQHDKRDVRCHNSAEIICRNSDFNPCRLNLFNFVFSFRHMLLIMFQTTL